MTVDGHKDFMNMQVLFSFHCSLAHAPQRKRSTYIIGARRRWYNANAQLCQIAGSIIRLIQPLKRSSTPSIAAMRLCHRQQDDMQTLLSTMIIR